jgi:hypothetical protein
VNLLRLCRVMRNASAVMHSKMEKAQKDHAKVRLPLNTFVVTITCRNVIIFTFVRSFYEWKSRKRVRVNVMR